MSTTTESPLTALRNRVRAGALNRPGVYRMLAETGLVIYVGKSKRLRTRLLGYFRARREEKAWRIVREARAVEWDYEPSEFASLLRELELIKRFRPLYNVRQKRDGLYSYLRLTADPAPKLHVVRRIAEETGSYFGPFRGGRRIAAAVRELNDVLQLRDCRNRTRIRFSDQGDLFGTVQMPLCPRHELRRCSAPCAGRCSELQYARQVELAVSFLSGSADQPIEELTVRMQSAADRWEFEHAASLRNRISRLEMLRAEFLKLRETLENLTFLYAVPGLEREHRVYAIRSGSIRGVYPAPLDPGERRNLLEQVAAHFRGWETPVDLASPQRVEQVLLVAHWFRTRPGEYGRTYPSERWSELPLSGEMGNSEMA